MAQTIMTIIGSVATTSPLEVWLPACLDTTPATVLNGSSYTPVVGGKCVIYVHGANVIILGGVA